MEGEGKLNVLGKSIVLFFEGLRSWATTFSTQMTGPRSGNGYLFPAPASKVTASDSLRAEVQTSVDQHSPSRSRSATKAVNHVA